MKKIILSDRDAILRYGGALSAFLGVILLGISFGINPGPPDHVTATQLVAFVQSNFGGIMWGGWLQIIGSLFIVIFSMSLVVLTNKTTELSGLLTIVGGTLLLVVNAIEVTGYMAALSSNPLNSGFIALDFIHAAQHLYYILAAPSLFGPLGFVIIETHVLPRIFSYTSFLLALLFALAGIYSMALVVLSAPLLIFASVQIIWWLAAAVVVVLPAQRARANSWNKKSF
jgi:hypothetical protein